MKVYVDITNGLASTAENMSIPMFEPKHGPTCECDDCMEDLVQPDEEAEAYQKFYGGKRRSELPNSSFLFPKRRAFPIVSPETDIMDALRNFGRMKGNMSYEQFVRKLYKFAQRHGKSFVDAIPDSTLEKVGIKK